ncbi:MAG: hypothetical protein HQ515_11160 [Phycisphaeraceae bacterium]|nr:hypothetical protein [Phycisphaeraceae bacterium]
MKRVTLIKVILLLAVSLMVASALAQPQGRGRGAYGDWVVSSEFNGRAFESILSFSRDQEGNRTAVWISFMGLTELKDVTVEDGKLSFTQTRRNRDGEMSESKFSGTIADGVLTGTMSGAREYELKGKRAPRMSRAAGQWEMKYSRGEREMTSMLIIKADAEGNLSAEMPSDRVQNTISDLKLENRSDLSFKRAIKVQDREFETTFTGTLERNEITGTFKSERGDMPATATRKGADLIGTWNLDLSSENRERKQRLVINPDLTALYGSMPVKVVKLEDGKVSFKIVMEFGQNTFEMDFAATLADSKLTGELVSSRSTQKVTGSKVVRRRGTRTPR